MAIHAACGFVEYTPPVGVPFGRFSHHTLLAQGVHSPLTARLMLLTDGNELVGLLVLDQSRMRHAETRALREAMATALGVKPGQFVVMATHTHNAPGLAPWRTADRGYGLLDALVPRVAELARMLKAQLTSVTLSYARRSVPGIAHNRRMVYRADDGREQVGTHGPANVANFLRREDLDEDELRLVLLHAGDGRLVGGIVNFPCHPTTMYSEPLWSADYPGVLRDALAEELGGPFLFINGFAGDQSPSSQGDTAAERCAHVGNALAAACVDAVGEAQPLDCSAGIAIARRNVTVGVRVPTYEQVDLAWSHLEKSLKDEPRGPLPGPMYGYAYHFGRPNPRIDDWLAREIVARWELYRRGDVRHPKEKLCAQAMRIGRLGFVGLPGEPFACFGRQMREQSPFDALLCAEHATGMGYLPPTDAFERGGYECCLGQQSRHEPRAGEKLTRAALRLLRGLAE